MRNPREIILNKINGIRELPTLPQVVLELEHIVRDPNTSARDVAAVVETDPAMTARLLKVANSAFYRIADREITAVSQAVAQLGLREVRKLCLAIGAMRLFVRSGSLVNSRNFWRHSLTVAATTRTVVNLMESDIVSPDDAFTAGLLHELGALVLDHFFENLYTIVYREAERSTRSIHLIEQEYLKINHAEIGGWLLEQWQLPTLLVEAVTHHHDPSLAPDTHRALCQVVHLADYAATKQGLAGPGEEYLAAVSARAWKDLGLQAAGIPELLAQIATESQRSSEFLAIIAA